VKPSQRRVLGAISGVAVTALCLAPGAISSMGWLVTWLVVLLAVGPVIYLLAHHWFTQRRRRASVDDLLLEENSCGKSDNP
jgi:hypothetical protein